MAASRFNSWKAATLAAAFASAALLTACEEHRVAPAEQPSAPAMRPVDLSGAPDLGPPPPPAPMPLPPPPGPRPGDGEVIYDLGPVVHGRDTMAPIPNPPERFAPRRPLAAAPCRRTGTCRPRRAGHPPVMRCRRTGACPPAGPRPHGQPAPAAGVHARPAPAAAKPGPHGTPGAKPSPAAGAKTPAKPAPAAKPGHGTGPAAVKPAPAPAGDHAQHLQAMQTALTAVVARTALLNAPELKPDQPADVTLTLPADFASSVRDEAEKDGLQDDAASSKLSALLSGDGYAVAPDQTQSQPLTVGQPTEFHWTVTAQQGAKGPLRTDVGLDLLGGGDQTLQLGSVGPAGKGGLHVSPRAWGAGLLVLLAVLVFGWLGRGRSARRRPPPSGLYQRPLDMGQSAPPPFDREG